MGTDERDRAKQLREDESDVEAHANKVRGARDDQGREPEDTPSDEMPDVEAHVNKH